MLGHFRTVVLLGTAVLGMLAGSARADVMTYTHTAAQLPNPYTDVFTLPAFNAAMGTLNSIMITESVTLNSTIVIYNAASTPQPYDSASAQVTATLTTAAGVMIPVMATATAGPGTANPGFNYLSPTATTQTVYSVLSKNLAVYDGAGQPLTFSVNYSGSTFSGTTSGSTMNVSLLFGGASTTGGFTSITYNYTPSSTAVPEPASMSLVACGLVGTVMIARRRRHSIG